MLNIKRRSWIAVIVVTAICLGLVAVVGQQYLLANGDNSESVNPDFFAIKVVDSETGRGVPLVELKTNNDVAFYTDSAGYIAFYESELMNKNVTFNVFSHGYSYKNQDGKSTVTLKTVPGTEAVVEIDRINIAERLYRITGQGIYADSVLLGKPTPLKNPVLNGRIMGQDSNHSIVYKDKIYWFWGDTAGPWSPLGNFRTTGATSELPEKGGLKPDVGVDLNYITRQDGFSKELVPRVAGDPSLMWVSALMVAKDKNGNERMLTGFSGLDGLTDEKMSGVLLWDDASQTFKERAVFPMNVRWKHPDGMATLYEDNGKEYYFFASEWPVIRVPAEVEAIMDINKYETFTCLKPGTTFKGRNTELNRDKNGKLVWEWRLDTPPITQSQEAELIKYGLMTEDEARFQLRNIDTGKPVTKQQGSINWNEYKQKWIMIGSELYGTSLLGEIYYAEADSPTGPWRDAKKIVTHKDYDFYNPIQHTFFDEDGGRIIYFEGTYTATFGGNIKTPYYDYNQVMYRLDLSDERLVTSEEPVDPTPTPDPTDDPTPTPKPKPSDDPTPTSDPTEDPKQGETPDDTPSGSKGGKSDDGDSPKTGDKGILAALFGVLISGGLFAAYKLRLRKEKRCY